MLCVDPMLVESSRDRYQNRLREAEEHRLAKAICNRPRVVSWAGVSVADALIALGGALKARYQPAAS